MISLAFSSTTSWMLSLTCLRTTFLPSQLNGPRPLSPMWIAPGLPTVISTTFEIQMKLEILLMTYYQPVSSDWELIFCSSFIWRTVLDRPAAISPLEHESVTWFRYPWKDEFCFQFSCCYLMLFLLQQYVAEKRSHRKYFARLEIYPFVRIDSILSLILISVWLAIKVSKQ